MEEKYNIEIIKSNRKTMSLEIKPDLRIILRAPLRATEESIQKCIDDHKEWLQKHFDAAKAKKENGINTAELMNKDIRELTLRARREIPPKVKYYADILGVTYGKITIRKQKSKWGSCSFDGNLNFNCLLMLAPEEVIDAIVVHEVCHRVYMNHSKDFYKLVYKLCPDYKACEKWLNENIALS